MGLSIATGIDRPHGFGELCRPTGLPLRSQNPAQGPSHERKAVLAGQFLFGVHQSDDSGGVPRTPKTSGGWVSFILGAPHSG